MAKIAKTSASVTAAPTAANLGVARPFPSGVSLFAAPADFQPGKKFKKLSLPPIVKWDEVPQGTTVFGKIVAVVEGPNDNIKDSPMLKIEHPEAGEFLLPLGGGILRPLGIMRGSPKAGTSTYGNAEKALEPHLGKTIVVTLTGHMMSTKIDAKKPKRVWLFDIQIEQ